MRIDSNFLSNNFMQSISENNKSTGTNKIFSNYLNELSNQENSFTEMKTEYLNGERDDIDNILIEGQKLNLNLSFALEVRNNLVDMVKQISNMQI